MFKKGVIIVSLFCLLLGYTFIAPFKLSASSGVDLRGLEDWLLGYNIYPVQIIHDREYATSLSGSSSSISGSISNVNLIQYTSSGVTGVSSTRPNGNGGVFSGSMTLGLTSSTTTYNLHKGLYCFELVLKDEYQGYINLQLKQGSTNIIGSTSTRSFLVNGNKLQINFVLSSEVTNSSEGSFTLTINSYDLVPANEIQYGFPIESYNFITSFMEKDYEQVGIDNYNNTYLFPIFKLTANSPIYRRYLYTGEQVQIVYMTNKALALSDFNFSSSNYENAVITSINRSTAVDNSQWRGLYRLNFTCTSTSTQQIKVNSDIDMFIPIYANVIGNSNGLYDLPVSTDFALEFVLNNRMLNTLDIIALGNNQSNQSVSNSDTTNQLASDTFETEEQLINNAETDLNNNLNSLDIANQNNNLFGNSKFIASASWVKTQFDNLTNNNAFGYMITFSLVIGIALVIVGKLRG